LSSASLALVMSAGLAAAEPVRAPVASDADARAAALEAKMTDAERIQMLHSLFPRPERNGKPLPVGAIKSASFTAANPRLGIPALLETDASLGVAWVNGSRGDGATPLASGLSLASTWSSEVAYRGSAMIASEARAKGFNVLLAGGVNLTREPRNGRNFEYLGEDPLLAGTLAGETIRAIQASHMISTVKHFAVNPQETGRMVANSVISEEAARESDLLAFQIAIERGHPGAVMCSYNAYNGPHACQSDFLLNRVLKGDWKYPGFVMSDWGAVRNVKDALAGLDRQSGEDLDMDYYFAKGLPSAVQTDPAMARRVHDMTRRMLRSMFEGGLFDDPPKVQPIDFAVDAAISRAGAQSGIVLLKNNGVLPLLKTAKTVAVIGGYANLGVMAGGGSSLVQPPEGPGLKINIGGPMRVMSMHPSAPLTALRNKLGKDVKVVFDEGVYPASAAKTARNADVVIVFATQWTTEGADAADLSLPQGQDAVVEAVTAANPNAIVVLETGGPVLMPWLDKAGAVVEAWYPGGRGGEAIADVLTGDVNPSGRLPVTFPKSLDQLPRLVLDDTPDPNREPGSQSKTLAAFDVNYNIEGSDVGYRWYARKGLTPLFPFGFGLSYTTFSYADLQITGGKTLTVSFTVKNDGAVKGRDVPQVYVTDRAGAPGIRLIGWGDVDLAPGATQRVTVKVDPRLLANWSAKTGSWVVPGGVYQVKVARSAPTAELQASTRVSGSTFH